METRLIYENPLQDLEDVKDWISEGNVKIEFDNGMVLSNGDPESMGDHAHWTYWLPQDFPGNIRIEWDFLPISEPGLCMLFFAAQGENGRSIFDDSVNKRDGHYPQYHSGDINTYHISYFRHKYASERAFRTCNLRKSSGFHFLTQGGDPLPPAEDALTYYQIAIEKIEGNISFKINNLEIFNFTDDGKEFGPVLKEGKIGFRQMAPMKAKYRNIRVYELLE